MENKTITINLGEELHQKIQGEKFKKINISNFVRCCVEEHFELTHVLLLDFWDLEKKSLIELRSLKTELEKEITKRCLPGIPIASPDIKNIMRKKRK